MANPKIEVRQINGFGLHCSVCNVEASTGTIFDAGKCIGNVAFSLCDSCAKELAQKLLQEVEQHD